MPGVVYPSLEYDVYAVGRSQADPSPAAGSSPAGAVYISKLHGAAGRRRHRDLRPGTSRATVIPTDAWVGGLAAAIVIGALERPRTSSS
jgi:hypothetical protein